MHANQPRRNWRPASDSRARALEHRTKIVVTNPQTKQNQLGMQWICNGYDQGIRVRTHSGNKRTYGRAPLGQVKHMRATAERQVEKCRSCDKWAHVGEFRALKDDPHERRQPEGGGASGDGADEAQQVAEEGLQTAGKTNISGSRPQR